ncbi:MAG: hypothetical protein H7Y86_06140 [Rhizobacter sp.]|nr:hypothetical protein [Ferruginibacter sp.]
MRKIIKLSFLLLLHSFFSEAQPQLLNKGVLLYQGSVGSNKLTSDRFWFRDSSVIYEQNSDYKVSHGDTVIFEGYETYKYTFFDLRTLKCQDYFSFSDTAAVESNYTVESGDAPGWNFYIGHNKKSLDSMFCLADTIIDKKTYKRIRYSERRPDYDYYFEETYFFVCNIPINNLVNIDKRLEKKLPGCMLQKIDMHQLTPYPMRDSTLFIPERNYLTKEEEKIFQQWQRNSLETALPVLTIEEVRKKPFLPIKYKQHPFYKQTLKWESEQNSNN